VRVFLSAELRSPIQKTTAPHNMAHMNDTMLRDHTVWRAALTAHRRRLRFVRDPETYAHMLREAAPGDGAGHRLVGAPFGVVGASFVRGRACNAYFVFTEPGVQPHPVYRGGPARTASKWFVRRVADGVGSLHRLGKCL
jgi:hypothetical protein